MSKAHFTALANSLTAINLAWKEGEEIEGLPIIMTVRRQERARESEMACILREIGFLM